MTPRDFLDSVIFSDQEFKANVRRRKVYPQEHGYMLHIGNVFQINLDSLLASTIQPHTSRMLQYLINLQCQEFMMKQQ